LFAWLRVDGEKEDAPHMSRPMRKGRPIRTQPPNDTRQGRATLLAGALVFVLVLGAFLPALSNGFIGFDDPDYVTENDHVRAGLTWEGVQWAFRSTEAANWHPLTRLSHMLDCELFGLAPRGHHLTSILLHALSATLLFVVLRRMTGALWRSFAVAALFGLHPLRVESVAWIAERKDVLCALFWMLTLWAYVRYAAKPVVSNQRPVRGSRSEAARASRFTPHVSLFYLLSLLFFACALMSKPMVVTLPFTLLLLDYWPLRRLQSLESAVLGPQSSVHAARKSQIVYRILLEKLPFFLAAALFSGITLAVQKHGGAVITSLPVTDRLANAVVSYARYLGKLCWPVDLAAFYPGVEHWRMPIIVAAALLLLGISAAAIALRRAHPYVLVGWLWYLGTLVPVIGLVQAGMQSMADRYSYVPSIGILLIIVWGAYELSRGWRYHAIVAAAATAAAALLCAGFTLRQLTYWKDTESLFRHALLVTKDNYGAHHALGMALDREGRLDEAIEEHRATLRARSNYVLAYNNLGVDLAQQGHLDEAIGQFRAALALEPTYADPHNNLGTTLEKQGRFDEALREFQEAVRLKPDYPDAHYNLGVALGRKGRSEQAAEEFQRVIQLKPSADAYNNLGVMLEREGRLEEAARQYQTAVQLKPAYPSAHYNFGVALARQGHLPEAVEQFREALRLKPDYPAAQTNLNTALMLLRERTDAPAAGSQKP
jgi:tetratricopeptide (TPR) repeat protein